MAKPVVAKLGCSEIIRLGATMKEEFLSTLDLYIISASFNGLAALAILHTVYAEWKGEPLSDEECGYLAAEGNQEDAELAVFEENLDQKQQ